MLWQFALVEFDEVTVMLSLCYFMLLKLIFDILLSYSLQLLVLHSEMRSTLGLTDYHEVEGSNLMWGMGQSTKPLTLLEEI